MKALGLVLLYDRKLGIPEDISQRFSESFPQITENLVKQGLLDLLELKNIMDRKLIFWGGIKEKFEEILKDSESIGQIAWQVFNNHSDLECSEEIKSLIYDGVSAPWKFTVMACVLYE